MAGTAGLEFRKGPERPFQALRALSVQFVSFMIEKGLEGQKLDKIVNGFTRHQTKIVGGVLGSAGLAGGAWAAASVWASSLGLWGSLGYALGFVSMPFWVPFAGGVAGLTAAGGAVYGALSLARSRGKVHKLQSIIGFSKLLINQDEFRAQDLRLMQRFLRAQNVKEKQIETLLQTSPELAQQLALKHLSVTERTDVARYIFPLVYVNDGVISNAGRRRFNRVCEALQLKNGSASDLSSRYRQRLDAQWAYMKNLVAQLNQFADKLSFDHREMEILREQLEQLVQFDPRRPAAEKKKLLVARLGAKGKNARLNRDDSMVEAAVMGAYALAHTAVQSERSRIVLANEFDLLISDQELAEEYKKSLRNSRQKVDKLYDTTREQIAMAAKKNKNN